MMNYLYRRVYTVVSQLIAIEVLKSYDNPRRGTLAAGLSLLVLTLLTIRGD